MRNATVFLAAVALSACTTAFHPENPTYVTCGSTICVVGTYEKQHPIEHLRSFGFAGDETVERRIPLHDVNAATFRLVGNGWATDGRNVWCGSPRPITTADRFHPIDVRHYGADGEVWEGCLQVITGTPAHYKHARSNSFHSLGCDLYQLEGEVYEHQGGAPDGYRLLERVPTVDSATFQIDTVTPQGCTAHDAQRTYSVSRNGDLRITSAGALPCGFARAHGTIYFGVKPMPYADANTFEVLTPDNCVTVYARDAAHVYRYMTPLEGIDAKTFRVVGHHLFADRNHVYRDVIPDRSTSPDYRPDCPDVDPATYMSYRPRFCGNKFTRYGRDAAHIYFSCTLLPGADPTTFEVVEESGDCSFNNHSYSRDAKSVWYEGRIVQGADPATFRIGLHDQAEDKTQKYRRGKSVEKRP